MIDNIYGVYKDNERLFIGTKKQLEERFDIKIKTLQYITDPNKPKRHKGKRIRLVFNKIKKELVRVLDYVLMGIFIGFSICYAVVMIIEIVKAIVR